MEWKYIGLAIITLPLAGFLLFLAGRLMGWGWATSWFQAKKLHEQEQNKNKESKK